jgi:hypothetical protein
MSNIRLGDMMVMGRPPRELLKALATIAGTLHPAFDSHPRIAPGKSKESCVLCSLAVRDFFNNIGFDDAAVRPVFVVMRVFASRLSSLGSRQGPLRSDPRCCGARWSPRCRRDVQRAKIRSVRTHARRPLHVRARSDRHDPHPRQIAVARCHLLSGGQAVRGAAVTEDRTYTIASDGSWITCHRCGQTSHNLNDVTHKYCAKCRRFHEYPIPLIDSVVDEIKGKLAGRPPEMQGVVLANLLALFLAGHAPPLRGGILRMHVKAVKDLIPVCEHELFGDLGFPKHMT